MRDDFIFGVTLCEVPAEVKEKDLEKLKELGVNGLRLHFSWKDIEKEKEKFDFSFYDSLIDKAKENGFFVIAGIGSGYSSMLPFWIVEEIKDELNVFSYIPKLSRFVNEAVEQFKGKIDIWQAENEINHTSFHVVNGWREKSWALNPVVELSVLLGIISIIKANDPEARVMINLECDNPNWEYFLKFFTENKLSFDIIGIDFYPCYSPVFSPDDHIFSEPERILKLSEIIDKASEFKKDVIVAETGYPSPKGLYTYENQASYIHQACQVALSSKAKGLFIWEFADQYSKKPEFPEYYFGLLDNNRKLKLAGEVYKNEIKREGQTIIISVKGILFREKKQGIEVYINNGFVGKTNCDGFFISENLKEGEYKIAVKGLLPWQVTSKKIKLDKGISESIKFIL
ncbi:MAG: beta-galactosidase [bacterium]